MACNCGNFKVVTTPTKQPCDDCLVVNSYRLPCDSGPDPCGDTIEYDLSTSNDLSACDCGTPVYSLVSYTEAAFDSVSINSSGLLEAITADWYVFGQDAVIRYKVNCPCNILSASGNVYVCFKNPCPQECHNSCEPCTGECIEPPIDVIIN
jgi:hypothetical protein